MQLKPIPYQFVRERVSLSWNDVLWGYEHQLIAWSTVVDLAIDRVCASSNDSLEIEMASLQKTEAHQVDDLLRKLAHAEPQAEKSLYKRKWLFLLLAWLFENKAYVADPLGEIELIYAEFDYPSEIEKFVRYMPVTDEYEPSEHSRAENEQRLNEHWQTYLRNAEREFGNRDKAP